MNGWAIIYCVRLFFISFDSSSRRRDLGLWIEYFSRKLKTRIFWGLIKFCKVSGVLRIYRLVWQCIYGFILLYRRDGNATRVSRISRLLFEQWKYVIILSLGGFYYNTGLLCFEISQTFPVGSQNYTTSFYWHSGVCNCRNESFRQLANKHANSRCKTDVQDNNEIHESLEFSSVLRNTFFGYIFWKKCLNKFFFLMFMFIFMKKNFE